MFPSLLLISNTLSVHGVFSLSDFPQKPSLRSYYSKCISFCQQIFFDFFLNIMYINFSLAIYKHPHSGWGIKFCSDCANTKRSVLCVHERQAQLSLYYFEALNFLQVVLMRNEVYFVYTSEAISANIWSPSFRLRD